MMSDDLKTCWEGKFLRVVTRGTWEFVQRPKPTGVVGIVAVTAKRELVLVEQYRPAVARRVVELPAGLAGDVEGEEDEALQAAAERELLEETGYRAGRWDELFTGLSSAGMTDEAVTIFLARELEKVGEGGGDASEAITVHLVPLGDLGAWLEQKGGDGVGFDVKIFAGVGAATPLLGT